jgi:nucleoside-diphosphate-sugar epimerase
MSKAKRTALVTGASGLAGGYMLAHLLEQGGWDIVAVSRRKPRIPGDYRHIAVDLLDPADCRAKLGPLTDIQLRAKNSPRQKQSPANAA